ncbi:MAG TPA: hypothetical protein PLB21_07245, partial [Actinomycetota bacterium]|nr:hypothetical protein [Actinomycetota bacterium]
MFRTLKEAVAIARSGMVDREYYQALTGRSFATSLAAARHYLATPERTGLSLHPLFEPTFLERKPEPDLVLRFLAEPKLFQKQSPHPAFDLAEAKRTLRSDGVSFSEGVWLAWVRHATPSTPVPGPPGAATVRWGDLRQAVLDAAVRWRAGLTAEDVDWADVIARPRRPGLTSIVVPIVGDLSGSVRRLSLLKGLEDREMVCTGFTSRALFCSFTALAQTRSLVVVSTPGASLTRQWNTGSAASSGDRLVFMSARATLSSEAVAELVGALADPDIAIVQPLNEAPNMTVQSAGAYFPADDVVPSPLLREHPTADAEALGRTRIPAAYSEVIALRSELFFGLRGFDEVFADDFGEVDLSLRAAAAKAGSVILLPETRAAVRPVEPKAAASAQLLRDRHAAPPGGASNLLRSAGFEVVEHRDRELADPSTDVRTILQEPVLQRTRAGLGAIPTLRWTIDTPVTAGWWAQVWGDWHFANSLARALRRLGQQVAVDTKQARGRETRRFDDVLLTVRGLDEVPPQPGRVNLMWVISHPDQVSAAEVAGYDRVFAASTLWAAERSAEWGVQIEPLLQCTDAELFHPGRAQRPPDDHAVFVGNIRPDRTRPMVTAALAAGVELDLYGT